MVGYRGVVYHRQRTTGTYPASQVGHYDGRVGEQKTNKQRQLTKPSGASSQNFSSRVGGEWLESLQEENGKRVRSAFKRRFWVPNRTTLFFVTVFRLLRCIWDKWFDAMDDFEMDIFNKFSKEMKFLRVRLELKISNKFPSTHTLPQRLLNKFSHLHFERARQVILFF